MIHFLVFYAKLFLHRLGFTSEKGQGLAEYSLILLLIAFAVIGALTLIGTSLSDYYNKIAAAFP